MAELKQNRYNTKQNMVTLTPEAAPVVRKMSPEESRILEHYAAPSPVVMVEQAFQAQEGADERTSGKDRSVALVIRLLPITAIWLVLSIGIVWKFNLQNNDAVLIFAALTAVTFYARLADFYGPLYAANLTTDFVFTDSDFANYKLLVIPNLYLVDDATAASAAGAISCSAPHASAPTTLTS